MVRISKKTFKLKVWSSAGSSLLQDNGFYKFKKSLDRVIKVFQGLLSTQIPNLDLELLELKTTGNCIHICFCLLCSSLHMQYGLLGSSTETSYSVWLRSPTVSCPCSKDGSKFFFFWYI